MFEKPASEMVVGSSAVITSLGPLKGAVIRRTKEDIWEQIGGKARAKGGEYYAWARHVLPAFKVVAVREERRFPREVSSGRGSSRA
jgi:hypothetical protein